MSALSVHQTLPSLQVSPLTRPALLLPGEEVRCYQPAVAEALGSEDLALILQQLHYRLGQPSLIEDGRPWYRASLREWRRRDFPGWSEDTLERHFKALEAMGVMDSAHLAPHPYDRTKYYTVNEQVFRARMAGCPLLPSGWMDLRTLGECIPANCGNGIEDPGEREKKDPAADFSLSGGEEEDGKTAQPQPTQEGTQDEGPQDKPAPAVAEPTPEVVTVEPEKGVDDAARSDTPASVLDEATLLKRFQALPAAEQEAITEQARQRMTPWVLRHFPGSWALRAEVLTIVAEQLQFSMLAGEGQHASDEVGMSPAAVE